MYPELFKIPFIGIPVHSYGLMLVIGLLLAMELAKFLARRNGMNPDFFANAAVLALISGLIGARIAFVLQNFSEFTTGTFAENVWNAANLTSGGLVYYGGFLLATPTLIVYTLKKKVPLLRAMDVVAPCLMVGLAFGRVGCFLNGCCWGEHCELPSPVAVSFPYFSGPYLEDFREGHVTPPAELMQRGDDGRARLVKPEIVEKTPNLREIAAAQWSRPLINTQLISTVTASLIAIATFFFFTLYTTPGKGFALMLMLEGTTRTLIEGLRVEPTVPGFGPLTLSMLIGIGVALSGVAFWAYLTRREKQEPRGVAVAG